MKLSVQFPMHTKSENTLRSLPFVVANAPHGKQMGIANSIARKVKKQKEAVRLVLDSQLPKLRSRVPSSILEPYADAKPNHFRITLIRISAGLLDDDGLAGAMKTVRDAVQEWIGCGDGPRDPASWRYAQQRGPAKVYAVRIEIEDDDPDTREIIRVCGPAIAKLGPVIGDCSHCGRQERPAPKPLDVGAPDALHRIARRMVSRPKQVAIIFRPAYYADPLDQRGDDLVLTPVQITAEPPPRTLVLRRRVDGRLYVSATLERSLERVDGVGEIWLYTLPHRMPAVAPTTITERRPAP